MERDKTLTDILDLIANQTVQLGQRDHEESELVTSILMHLPRLAALIGAGGSSRLQADKLAQSILVQVTGLLSRKPEEAEFVSTIVTSFNRLALDGGLWARPRSEAVPTRRKAKRTRRGDAIEYRRRIGRAGDPLLVEARGDGKKEFHVARADYDLVIKSILTVAQAEGFRFDDLAEVFVTLGGRDQKSMPALRVILRFLRNLAPPLIERRRAKYFVGGAPNRFRKASDQAWEALPEEELTRN